MEAEGGTQFTCFTSTKVQILKQQALQGMLRGWGCGLGLRVGELLVSLFALLYVCCHTLTYADAAGDAAGLGLRGGELLVSLFEEIESAGAQLTCLIALLVRKHKY
jgi:hypothetical protein